MQGRSIAYTSFSLINSTRKMGLYGKVVNLFTQGELGAAFQIQFFSTPSAAIPGVVEEEVEIKRRIESTSKKKKKKTTKSKKKEKKNKRLEMVSVHR